MYEKCHRFWHGKLWYPMIFTSEHSGFTCKLLRTKWICCALKDFILNIYELLTHRNDRKSISNTEERNSAPIVEEHVRNKRRRFTTREIYLLCRPRVYILAQKNEREDYERKSHLVRVANNSFSFVMQRVKGLTLRASGVDFKLERCFLGF